MTHVYYINISKFWNGNQYQKHHREHSGLIYAIIFVAFSILDCPLKSKNFKGLRAAPSVCHSSIDELDERYS